MKFNIACRRLWKFITGKQRWISSFYMAIGYSKAIHRATMLNEKRVLLSNRRIFRIVKIGKKRGYL